jgi:hypothetical protein
MLALRVDTISLRNGAVIVSRREPGQRKNTLA